MKALLGSRATGPQLERLTVSSDSEDEAEAVEPEPRNAE